MSAYPSPRFLNITADGTLDVTGESTLGDVTADRVTNDANIVEAGNYAMTGVYSYSTAPWGIRMALPQQSPLPVGTSRNVMQVSINNDTAIVQSPNGRQANIRGFQYIWQTGNASLPTASQWGGPRTWAQYSYSENAAPFTSLEPPGGVKGYAWPSVNMISTGMLISKTRGGLAPELTYGQGSGSNTFNRMDFVGAPNQNHWRWGEWDIRIDTTSSMRGFTGGGYGTRFIGLAPTNFSRGMTFSRVPADSIGLWNVYMAGGDTGFSGSDPIQGNDFVHSASSNEPSPTALRGLWISDVRYFDNAISWAGGDISGGVIGANGTGRLRIGPAYLKKTTTGASLDVNGNLGQPAAFYFKTTDGNLVNGDIGMPVYSGGILDGPYGGTYRIISASGNVISVIQVLIPEMCEGTPASNPIPLTLRRATGGDWSFNVTETATTTVVTAPIPDVATGFLVGRQLLFRTGVAAGEARTITAYDGTTGQITVSPAYSTVPTATLDFYINGNFTLNPIAATPDTIQNGWEWTVNGGTGTATYATGPTRVILTGDGTNEACIDQEAPITPLTSYTSRISFQGGTIRVQIGTARGLGDLLDTYIMYSEESGYQVSNFDFTSSSAATVWIRFANAEAVAVEIGIVRGSVTGTASVTGIRASVIPQYVTINQTWTPLTTLDIQPSGGAITVGGTVTFSGAISAASFRPTGSTVPTNGLYLPAANTLGWAVNSAAEMQMTATALSPAVNDGLAFGSSSLGWADAFYATGAVLDFGAGNYTLTHSAGNLAASGSFTATSHIPSGSTVPTNGMYLPSVDTVGFATASTGRVKLTTTAFGPIANDGAALGVVSLAWSDLAMADGAVMSWGTGPDYTITHSTGVLTANGSFTATGFNATGTGVPANGMYLVSSNTLGLSTNTTSRLQLSTSALFPASNDGVALGTGSLKWSDLFLASGALIDWNNGDLVLTHSANLLTLSGGGWTVNDTGTSLGALSGGTIRAAAADGTATRIGIWTATVAGAFTFQRVNTSTASPSALASGDVIGSIEWRGWDTALTTSRAQIAAYTSEAWASGADGTELRFFTTPNLSTTQTLVATLGNTGNLTLSTGYYIRIVTNSTGAATGTTRADALQLAKEINRVPTVAAGTGVILPTGVIGMVITVFNAGANVLKVYANGSETIDGTAGSTGVNLTNGLRCNYYFTAANTWISAQLGAVSA